MDENTLVYDIATVPHGTNIEEVVYLFKVHRIIIYDSTKGNEPRIRNGNGHVKFYNSSNKIDMKEYEDAIKILNEEIRD